MPGAFFGIEIARRGMRVHQHGLDIIGHNVANASTPGYSRQAAVIQASNPHWVPSMDSYATPGQFGTGAEVSEIRRIKDEYLDNNVRNATTSQYYWQDQVSFLSRSESLFAEPASEGISQCITDFFKAWMVLNNVPGDAGAKSAVISMGERLASMTQNTYNQLGSVSDSIAKIEDDKVVSGKLNDDVNRINDIFTQIWDTTAAIERVYGVNQQPNDLLDKRDMLLEELSQYGSVEVTFASNSDHKPTGRMESLSFMGKEIKLPESTERYDSGTVPEVSLKVAGDKITLSITKTKPADPEEINLTDDCTKTTQGSLLGMERARLDIKGYQEMLENLTDTMSEKINDIINPSNDPTKEFFTGSLAGKDFTVNADIMKEDFGQQANDVARLRDSAQEIGDDFKGSFSEYFGLLATNVGDNARKASDMAVHQAAINHQITGLRESVSGVAINEELTLMIQFQYGFQASARMINTMDAMLDVVINRLF